MKVVYNMFLFSFKDLLSTTIYKVLVFIGGIIIGILIVMLIYLIVSLIHKRTRLKKNNNNVMGTLVSDLKVSAVSDWATYLTF